MTVEQLVLLGVLLLSLCLVPLGLPGIWLMLAAAMGFDWLVPGERIGWVVIGICVAMAVVAEVFEFTLAARYTRKYGGSRRAGWGAILGGIVGAFLGVPVPIIGSVIGAFGGAFVGALLMEFTRAKDATSATRVATGALIGRVVATAMKMAIACAIVAVLMVAAWI